MTKKERNEIIMRCHDKGLRSVLIANCMGLTEKFVNNIISREVKNAKKESL